jgi:acyl carrier protein
VSVSSRTPEGQPLRCEICGDVVAVDVADAGDAVCPRCGSLMWKMRSHFAELLHVPSDEIDLDRLDEEFAQDSLELVELAMGLEEVAGPGIDPSELHGIRTIREFVALIRRRQQEGDDGDAE